MLPSSVPCIHVLPIASMGSSLSICPLDLFSLVLPPFSCLFLHEINKCTSLLASTISLVLQSIKKKILQREYELINNVDGALKSDRVVHESGNTRLDHKIACTASAILLVAYLLYQLILSMFLWK